jgi:hypothetical protein
LKRRYEMVVEVLTRFVLGQCVHPERFGVVSGELGVLKVAGDMEQVEQLIFAQCLPGRLGGPA